MQQQIIAKIKIPVRSVSNPSRNSDFIVPRSSRCVIIIVVVAQFESTAVVVVAAVVGRVGVGVVGVGVVSFEGL